MTCQVIWFAATAVPAITAPAITDPQAPSRPRDMLVAMSVDAEHVVQFICKLQTQTSLVGSGGAGLMRGSRGGTHTAASHPTSHTRHGDNQAGNHPRQTHTPVSHSPDGC